MEGLVSKSDPAPFSGFANELFTVIPPFTLVGAAKRGPLALLINVLVAVAALVIGTILSSALGTGEGNFVESISDQWLFLAVGYYSVFCWAAALRRNDPPTFKLIWGSPAFLTSVIAYSTVAFMAYSVSYWGAPYAERTFGVSKSELGFLIGAPGAVAGFLGVILGGAMSDWLQQRFGATRVWLILFGLVTPLPAMYVQFTTGSPTVFYIANVFAGLLAASALGAAAATTQSLVLPRMRATATATFFLGTTLVGLALGPYMAGFVSAKNGDDLSLGVLSTIAIAPIGLIAVVAALKLAPDAMKTVVERGYEAGETEV